MKASQTYKIPAYALACALLTTLAGWLAAHRPTVLQMEYAVYDTFQKYATVDVHPDEKPVGEPLQPLLGELLFVNLDTSFFNLETDRVRRGRLAQLLDSLGRRLEPKAIFLDFLFTSASPLPEEDTALIRSIRALENWLVLPYGLPPRELGILETDTFPKEPALKYIPRFYGYLDYRAPISKDVVYRYVQLGREEDEQLSAGYALVKALRKKKELPPTKNIPEVIEINYVLRNQPPRGRREAIRWYNGSSILDGTAQLPEEEKVVFIGLFDDYSSKYQLPIDLFRTPVAQEMNGVYLAVNSYLNVAAQSYLRYPSWLLVFITNLALAGLGAAYYEITRSRRKKSWLALEVLLSIAVFGAFFLMLYQLGHIRFPFVATTVFWAMNQHLYRAFQKSQIKNHTS
ncbi:MAG: CHASE2 domain-containing protein [Phaeodactylibacter sp.]|nr:CHASE2 domain-containing protein [Phaeodactylibacter sp.]